MIREGFPCRHEQRGWGTTFVRESSRTDNLYARLTYQRCSQCGRFAEILTDFAPRTERYESC